MPESWIIVPMEGCRDAAATLAEREGEQVLLSPDPVPEGERVVVLFDGHRTRDLLEALMRPSVLRILDVGAHDDGNALGRHSGASPGDGDLLVIRLSTAAAMGDGVAKSITRGLAERIPGDAVLFAAIQDALQEALGNAVIHGNLGLDGKLRHSFETIGRFGEEMTARLADPAYASRPITIETRWTDERVEISVQDVGDGFETERILLPQAGAASGRGLAFICDHADAVTFHDGGRRIEMTFERTAAQRK